jgi:hypothetical protein
MDTIFYEAVNKGNYKKVQRIYNIFPDIQKYFNVDDLFKLSMMKNVGTFMLLSKIFNIDIYQYKYNLSYLTIDVLDYLLQLNVNNFLNIDHLFENTKGYDKCLLLHKYGKLNKKIVRDKLYNCLFYGDCIQFKFITKIMNIDEKFILTIFILCSSINIMRYNLQLAYENLNKIQQKRVTDEYDLSNFISDSETYLNRSIINGDTIMHYACKNNKILLINYLISRFSIKNIKDLLYVTNLKNEKAIDYANSDILSLFEVLTKPSLIS